MKYTEGGNLGYRSGYKIVYNDLNQLVNIVYKDTKIKEIHYDMMGRPMLIIDHATGNNVTIVYTMESSPWLVTHCYDSNIKKLYKMKYQNDNLIDIEDKEDIHIVIADRM